MERSSQRHPGSTPSFANTQRTVQTGFGCGPRSLRARPGNMPSRSAVGRSWSRMLPQSEKTPSTSSPLISRHRCISTTKNKFVHLALQSTIAVAAEMSGVASVTRALASGMEITVVGDNDFYSQREKVCTVSSCRCVTLIRHTLSSPR